MCGCFYDKISDSVRIHGMNIYIYVYIYICIVN